MTAPDLTAAEIAAEGLPYGEHAAGNRYPVPYGSIQPYRAPNALYWRTFAADGRELPPSTGRPWRDPYQAARALESFAVRRGVSEGRA